MTPSTTSRFDINSNKLRVTDTFNYASIIYSSAYGNVTAKIGNSIFHQNTDFDSDADIVIGTNTFKDIDLPTTNGKIQPGSYTIIYNVMVNYGSSAVAPGASNFDQIVITPSSSQFINQVNELLNQFASVEIQLLFGSQLLATSTITGTSGTNTIQFEQTSTPNYADIDAILISVTYTQQNEYLYDNCDLIEASVNAEANCAFAQVTVQDTTKYPAYNSFTLNREMVINYPLGIDGNPVESPFETSEPSITIGPYIWSGNYTINLSSAVSWIQEDGLIIAQVANAQKNLPVQCDAGLCKAIKCLESLRTKFMTAQKQGSRDIGQLTMMAINTVFMCNNYQIAIQCQDTTLAATILTELVAYLEMNNCKCGCGDEGGGAQSVPVRIYPLYSNVALINGVENARQYE